jgi:protein TonB
VLTAVTSLDLATRLHRGTVGTIIVAAHIGLLYAAMALGPELSSRFITESVTAHFVESVSESRPQWQPPEVSISAPPLDLREPLVVPIEVPIEATPSTHQIVARAMTAPPTQAPPPRSAPKLISSVEYVREPAPRYPPQSRRLGEQGLVVLRVLIDEKGQACSIEVESSSGYARLDHAAKEAVGRAAFRPYVEDGEPRRALVLIPIEFSLNRGTA